MICSPAEGIDPLDLLLGEFIDVSHNCVIVLVDHLKVARLAVLLGCLGCGIDF